MITINYNVLICFLSRRADRPRRYGAFCIAVSYQCLTEKLQLHYFFEAYLSICSFYRIAIFDFQRILSSSRCNNLSQSSFSCFIFS